MEYDTYYDTWFSNFSSTAPEDYGIEFLVLCITTGFTFFISLAGFVGNGMVIWLLGFHTKRTPFTIYVLNLSIADFSVLTGLGGINICWLFHFFLDLECYPPLQECFYVFLLFVVSASQFFLTAISIDRCVCIFFPLWHKCHRPSHLSTIICVAIWALTFLISCILNMTFWFTNRHDMHDIKYYQFLLNVIFFVPVMSASTLAMLIKVCLMSPQNRRGKLSTVILLALVLFLLFAFPLNFIEYLSFCTSSHNAYLYEYGLICTSLNCSVNPLIYFLVGRRKRGQARGSGKKLLEQLFVEEKNSADTPEPTLQTEL